MNKENKINIATKSLLKLKKKIGLLMNTGSSRISFKNPVSEKITGGEYTSIVSNELARNIIKEKQKYLTIKPKKMRLYKVYYKKKKLVEAEKAKIKLRVKTEKSKPEFVTQKINKYHALRKKLNIKDRFKDLNSLSYKKKKKLINDKTIYTKKIRQYRHILKKSKLYINNQDYRKIYLKIKGNFYNSEKILNAEIKSKIKDE